MSGLVLFLIAVLVPVYFGSPRTASMWLSIQALSLAWNLAAQHGLHSTHTLVSVVEIVLIRGGVAPWLLRRASRQLDDSTDHLLPSNLFAWLLGASLVIVAFEFAVTAVHGGAALTLGTVCATVVLAMLLLSYNDAAVAQIFGLLLLENAIALFESTLPALWSPWVHAMLSCIYVLTVWVGVRLMRHQADRGLSGEVSRQVL